MKGAGQGKCVLDHGGLVPWGEPSTFRKRWRLSDLKLVVAPMQLPFKFEVAMLCAQVVVN